MSYPPFVEAWFWSHNNNCLLGLKLRNFANWKLNLPHMGVTNCRLIFPLSNNEFDFTPHRIPGYPDLYERMGGRQKWNSSLAFLKPTWTHLPWWREWTLALIGSMTCHILFERRQASYLETFLSYRYNQSS